MKTLIISTFMALLILVLPNEGHQEITWPLQGPQGKDLIAKSGQVTVRVSVIPMDLRVCTAPSSWRWGAINHCPETFVSALEVKVKEKALFIPLSAFCGLGDPSEAKIKHRLGKGCFAVELTGGDAFSSYSAILEFKNNVLSERIVQHGELPDEIWEKTIYKLDEE